jgi:hypothetical protein
MQVFIHYSLHLIFPIFIAYIFFKKEWKKVYLIFLLTMLVDLDHLFSNPIFLSNRCSIGYHYLHSFHAILIYLLALFLRKPYKIIAIGLLFHMFTDFIDCIFTFKKYNNGVFNESVYNFLNYISNLLK